MTTAPVFISESFSTWTFDPSVVIPEAVREGRFTFPVEVLHAFSLQGLKVGVTVREGFATTIVDNEFEVLPTGENEMLALVQSYDPNDGGAQGHPVFLKAGQKIAILGYGSFIVLNSN